MRSDSEHDRWQDVIRYLVLRSSAVMHIRQPGQVGSEASKGEIAVRKRHILVDTEVNQVVVIVRAANISDWDGADCMLAVAQEKSSGPHHVWADIGHSGGVGRVVEGRVGDHQRDCGKADAAADVRGELN
jgi:hypothetical protein